MATELKMPKLGMTMTEGILNEWIVEEGDTVKQNEVVFSVTTDKVTIDVEAPVGGTILKIIAEEGNTYSVGHVLGYIGEPGEVIDVETNNNEQLVKDEKVEKQEKSKVDINRNEYSDDLRATPAARIFARKNDINLNKVIGTGVSGRIKLNDVKNYKPEFEKLSYSKPSYEDIGLSQIQKISAKKMTESFTQVPHFYLTIRVGVGTINEMLQTARPRVLEEKEIKATFTDVLVWILSRVLPEHPKINSEYLGDKIRLHNNVNIGIAADTDNGLVVPVIHNAENMTFLEIVEERDRLVKAARNGSLTLNDMEGGTFTVSNLGMYGIDCFQAIINTPQSALLAVGSVNEGLLSMSLSCDHRIIDGATGAKFLKRLKEVMENPASLLDKNLF